MKTGLLLPHFGEHANGEKIIAGSVRAEQLGFDSVWVRDHIVFEPHGEFEKPDPAFYEALTVLTAVGAATRTLTLGTGALIPFRHPVHAAMTAATMTRMVGDRLILGLGTGNFDSEFATVGLGGIPRVDLVRANVEIWRDLWSGASVTRHDGIFDFDEVSVHPQPPAGHIPVWYCGNTPKSVRLAAEFCDGWMPGRISLPTMRKRVTALEEAAAAGGRPRPAVGAIPTTSIAATREEALAQVNVPGLLQWANNAKFWVKPPSGTFSEVADIEGVLVYGTPDDVVEQVKRLAAAGVDHLVFDFRLSFGRWEEQMELLGSEVLPQL
jgi:alkanesulfonate monooxygenase SsuD/methylene tetrahydromethanopterin reductase-like flavin-dependent oxidoreductase (luciferase family)